MNLSDFPEWINSMYAHNVTAILVSQIIKLPTVNGIASFNPPDWNFSAPWEEDYDRRVLAYAEKHRISGLCKLDLNKKTWVPPLSPEPFLRQSYKAAQKISMVKESMMPTP